jgi:polyribonucleotide nucleotidyltransferase
LTSPLVEYEERLYAAGRIPGSFFRREGRPAEQAILTARVTDRPIRPLFPNDLRNEVQIIITALSHDQEHTVDMLCIVGASAALTISDIPWEGPIAGVRVGLIDGKITINPTIPEMENSKLDLRVAGTKDAIIMVECGAEEVDEATMVQALRAGHDAIQEIVRAREQLRSAVSKPSEYRPPRYEQRLRSSARGGQQIATSSPNAPSRRAEAELDDLRDVIVAEVPSTDSVESAEGVSAFTASESRWLP